MIAHADALLKPLTIKGLTIRNRVMSTSHAPGYGRDGKPQERYQLYHEEKAKGGIGLTMFGGSSSVALDSPAAPWNQISVADDSVIPFFRSFSERIHRHGAKLMIQLTHMGRRTKWDTENWLPTVSASPRREPASRTIPKELEEEDIARIVRGFGEAARRCREGGLDGCEISAAHGHLVDQFWSPSVNQRTDKYGGSLENRMRFGIEVLEAMRAAAGDDYVIGIRMSGDELVADGLSQEECLRIATEYASRGLVDFVNLMGGQARDHIAHAISLPNMSFPVAPFLYLPSALKRETDVPVFHAQRVTDLATAARAVAEGHVDMVAMTRAHIADPHLVKKLSEGRADDIRQCVGAGYCIDRIYVGGDALCIQNAATGREATMPHVIPKAERRRTVVVIGAGPGGLEAARVSAERGHRVVLFEKERGVGGQINIAAKGGWREALSGIPRWLFGQVTKLGVELRLGVEATRGRDPRREPGRRHRGDRRPAVEGPRQGCRARGHDLGRAHGDRRADRLGAPLRRDGPAQRRFDRRGAGEARLPRRDGDARPHAGRGGRHHEPADPPARTLQARRRDDAEHGADRDLPGGQPPRRGAPEHHDGRRGGAGGRPRRGRARHAAGGRPVLRPQGQIGEPRPDRPRRARRGQPQPWPDGEGFALYRIGDATAGRNIHAAIYDALRLCKDL